MGQPPRVDDLGQADWNPYYYHRATADGIGFDRATGGSDAISQYAPKFQALWSDPATTPENLLLWFHRMAWDAQLGDGRTLWQALIDHYNRGVSEVARMQAQWAALESGIDQERFDQVTAFLAIQAGEAKWRRDASIAYWQSVNGLNLPGGTEAPEHDLEYYQGLTFPYAPGQGGVKLRSRRLGTFIHLT